MYIIYAYIYMYYTYSPLYTSPNPLSNIPPPARDVVEEKGHISISNNLKLNTFPPQKVYTPW